MASSATLDIDGRSVTVSNLDKVFYPRTGFTKGAVIDYYIKVAPVLLPHLTRRPLSLKRYPNGVEGVFFYEKECPAHRPDWMATARAPKNDGGSVNYCVIDDLPSLVWAANLADLELHTFLHRAPALSRPTSIAFDLDPGEGASIIKCYQVAIWIKSIFDTLELQSFAKTSGSKGLQIYVPLNTPVNYPQTKAVSHAIATLLERQFPEHVVSRMQKSLRKGKVLVDWSQNDAKKTTVNAYSLRAQSAPTVSTPISWKELTRASNQKRILSFGPEDVLKRIATNGDFFLPLLHLKQKLPLLKSLAHL